VLQIQAVFPDGRAVVIDRFGDYEDTDYSIQARAERGGTYRLYAQPLGGGVALSTKAVKVHAFTKTLKALHIPEPQIAAVQKKLEESDLTELGGKSVPKIFRLPDLIEAGFEPQ
jgi:hypothetical protein